MVPATDFDYKRYLASREWALLKEQVRERSKDLCEHCKVAAYEETHHSTYQRIGHEEVTDLVAVCRPCHAWLSAKSDVNPQTDVWLYSERIEAPRREGAFHLVYRLGIDFHVPLIAAACKEDPLFKACLLCKYGGLELGTFMKEYWVEATRS